MGSNRWSFAELKEKIEEFWYQISEKFEQSKISLIAQWINRKIQNAWNQIKAKPVLPALLFCFAIPSYWARENIAAAIQQANIDFTGAIWFGGLLLCAWLILLRTAKQPRPVQVMTAGAVSLLIFFCIAESIRFLIRHQALSAKIWETGTFWTLAALLISSPVAFVVWRFRDENQSKDINLKEFQKISEWVTGAHFQEEKHSEKFSGSLPENADAVQPSERSREYYRPAASAQALHTFSKQDGAVGLQIAAVYNLLPFYRGDYGQAFEKPSVHLLHSAWQVLQHDILQELDKTDDNETRDALIQKLHQRADSPLGQAITRVLLACDYAKKPLLHRHLEILRGICLSGMNFELAGLEKEILRDTLFCGQDFNGAQLQGVQGIMEWNLSHVDFKFANLADANFLRVNLSGSKLIGAKLSRSKFNLAHLDSTDFSMANLCGTRLDCSNLSGAKLVNANLSDAQLGMANLSGAIFNYANLHNAEFAMAFFDKTQFDGANLSNASLLWTVLHKTGFKGVNLSNCIIKHTDLLEIEILNGSLIGVNSLSQYTLTEQNKLKEKGLIILYPSNKDNDSKGIFHARNSQRQTQVQCATDKIPFPIDLEKTRENNPDWEISIK